MLYSLMKEKLKLHQLSTSLQVNLEVYTPEGVLKVRITKLCTCLHQAPSTSTQLHPVPSTSTQLISVSIAHNWEISPNLGQKVQSCPLWLKIGSHSILEMLIPNPDLDFWNFNPKIHFWANLGPKSQNCPFCLKIVTHSISRMPILIPTLNFWIFDPKICF